MVRLGKANVGKSAAKPGVLGSLAAPHVMNGRPAEPKAIGRNMSKRQSVFDWISWLAVDHRLRGMQERSSHVCYLV